MTRILTMLRSPTRRVAHQHGAWSGWPRSKPSWVPAPKYCPRQLRKVPGEPKQCSKAVDAVNCQSVACCADSRSLACASRPSSHTCRCVEWQACCGWKSPLWLVQVIFLATVALLIGSLATVAVPKLAGDLIDICIQFRAAWRDRRGGRERAQPEAAADYRHPGCGRSLYRHS